MEATKEKAVARTRVWDSGARTIAAQLVTKKDKGAQGITCNWVLEFDGVTDQELCELASRAVIIGEQDLMRKLTKPEEAAKQTISVREFIDRERTPKGPPTAERAANLIAKLDVAEKAKVYRDMAKEMNVAEPAWVTEALGVEVETEEEQPE